jgi:hypothetical protein
MSGCRGSNDQCKAEGEEEEIQRLVVCQFPMVAEDPEINAEPAIDSFDCLHTTNQILVSHFEIPTAQWCGQCHHLHRCSLPVVRHTQTEAAAGVF